MSTEKSLVRYLDYLHRDGGRYWDLTPLLEGGVQICGVVLHDEAGPLRQLQTTLTDRPDIQTHDTDPSRRYKGWPIDFHSSAGSRRVLVLETGMGSMNASNAMYELAALLPRTTLARRIIKIGTCSGLYADIKPGTVLVLPCAFDDEGATKWNCPDGQEWENELRRRLRTRTPINADLDLTDRFRAYLAAHRTAWPGFIGASYENRVSAIWTLENFHGVRHRVQKMYPLFQEYKDSLPADTTVPICIENECSSHFSAGEYLGLPVAAALVVSWSCTEILSLATKGENSRRPEEKDRVHAVEGELLVRAVNYLVESATESPG